MLGNRLLPLATLFCVACSGGEKKTDETPAEPAGDILSQCQKQADIANKQADMFANVTTGSRAVMEASFADFIRVAEKWEAEDSPCAAEGASVTERMTIQKATSAKLEEAEDKGTEKIIRFLEPNTDEAREMLKTVFASGRHKTNGVLEAANSIDRNYRKRLLAEFQETKKLGQLREELKTTCVFSDQAIDPNAEKITENFRSNFRGAIKVHALCRIPLPAEKFAGDEKGQLQIILDDDPDPTNGVLHTGDLGTPEKWKTTQWFSGSFSVPQGPAAQKDSGYYYVRMKAARPTMGDEELVHNWFYWHR